MLFVTGTMRGNVICKLASIRIWLRAYESTP